MSSTPKSATPNAGSTGETKSVSKGKAKSTAQALGKRATDLGQRAAKQAGRIAGLAKDNPKKAIAAGAAVAAGVAAAAAIPIVRAARRKSANGSTPAAPKAKPAPKAPARKRAPARRAPAKQTPA